MGVELLFNSVEFGVPKQLPADFQTVETSCGREGHTRPRGSSESPNGVGPKIRRTRKTQRDGHNSGVKIWSLCSVSSTLSHANLQQPFRTLAIKWEVNIIVKKSSCVFLPSCILHSCVLFLCVVYLCICLCCCAVVILHERVNDYTTFSPISLVRNIHTVEISIHLFFFSFLFPSFRGILQSILILLMLLRVAILNLSLLFLKKFSIPCIDASTESSI